MVRLCLACSIPLTGQQRKWCSNACAQRGAYNLSRGRSMDWRGWIPSKHCGYCGVEMVGQAPQAKYCSDRCHWDNHHAEQKRRRHEQRRASGLPLPGDVVPCANPQCVNTATYYRQRAFCSRKCQIYFRENKHWLGEGPSTRIFFTTCVHCGKCLSTTSRNKRKSCQSCTEQKDRARWHKKNHTRRAAGIMVVTVDDLRQRDGGRCNICGRRIDFNLSGRAKWGPTIDHLLPVSLGGTNDADNLALAHRVCNTSRNNRKPAQLLLS